MLGKPIREKPSGKFLLSNFVMNHIRQYYFCVFNSMERELKHIVITYFYEKVDVICVHSHSSFHSRSLFGNLVHKIIYRRHHQLDLFICI
jgi:hypothetical protein